MLACLLARRAVSGNSDRVECGRGRWQDSRQVIHCHEARLTARPDVYAACIAMVCLRARMLQLLYPACSCLDVDVDGWAEP